MGKVFQSVNPYDQQVIAEFEVFSDEKIDSCLTNAGDAFQHWKNTSFQVRSDLFIKLADILRKNKEKYARNMSLEMGKTLKESEAEVEKCAVCCVYYAEHGEKFLKDEVRQSDASKSLTVYDPTGAVFAVMPWNFPFWQVIRFAVPTIMAGNVGLLKHAKNVTQCALHLEEAFTEAGFPVHVFQSLIAEASQSEKIIAHDIVQGVTLTGSEAAGSSVAAIAGKHIKKTVMELGGSDAFIILDDANIIAAAKTASQSRMQNAGQSCIAAKRFIVVEKVKNDFLHAFKNEVEKIIQGDPLDPATIMGPVSSLRSAEDLEQQQKISVAAGAEIVTGAERQGANYKPTILTGVKDGMPAYKEELFGPVASVIAARDVNDAIAIANSHRYGLGATIFSEDTERAYHFARRLEAGSVFINTMVKSDPRLPFGGVKKSGYGRELSELGMREFLNVKTIYVK